MKGDGSLGLGGEERGGVKVISRLLLESRLEDVEEKKDYLWLGVGVACL